jgi:hypothetical protein
MLDKTIYPAAPSYYHYYFDLVESNDLLAELQANATTVESYIRSIAPERWNFAYAEGKWSVAEVLRHTIDTERIFAYRALRFSRLDPTPLPGFNENTYIESLKDNHVTPDQLLREFLSVRQATVTLFESMNHAMLRFPGNANGQSVTAEMLGFMIVGHTKHHLNVLRDRYPSS